MGSYVDRLDQLEAMRMGTEYRFPIQIREFRLAARPLTMSETLQIAAEVQEIMSKLPQNAKNALTEHTLLAKETIKLASTSDYGANDPKITDYILDRMTPDEITHLFKQYVTGCDKVNPNLELIPADEIRGLVESIKRPYEEKKTAEASQEVGLQLIELSFSQLVSVCRLLITEG
jgi:hypothetical protein